VAQWNKNSQSYLANGTTLFEAVMIADKDGNILNTAGSASNIPIATGGVTGYSHINKFGYRSTLATTGFETIWDGAASNYTYQTVGTAIATSDAAASADDTKEVNIQGLDENYNEVSETITIGGGASTAQFSRVFRARMVSENNDGNVTITTTGTVAYIQEDAGQTLMAVYTIPAGKTGYLIKLHGTVDKNQDAIFRLVSRDFGTTVFNVKGQFGVFANSFDYDYPVPLVFSEKTDIEVRADAGNSMGGGALFDIILVDN